MKKFLNLKSKNENVKQDTSSYVGKSFSVGRYTVTVEDVIAEGKITLADKIGPNIRFETSFY